MHNTRRKLGYVALTVLFLIGIVGYSGWRGLIRPWHVAQGLAGAPEQSVLDRLGEPDLVFRNNGELQASRLVPGSYVFTPFPGPSGQSPPGVGWAAYNAQTRSISVGGLPDIHERAYWYDLPLTAGILLYVKDGKVIAMYHGGT